MMRMACVMCQIAPIKADLYFLFILRWGRRKESHLKVKKEFKEEEEVTG